MPEVMRHVLLVTVLCVLERVHHTSERSEWRTARDVGGRWCVLCSGDDALCAAQHIRGCTLCADSVEIMLHVSEVANNMLNVLEVICLTLRCMLEAIECKFCFARSNVLCVALYAEACRMLALFRGFHCGSFLVTFPPLG